jgi:hypothetical protein
LEHLGSPVLNFSYTALLFKRKFLWFLRNFELSKEDLLIFLWKNYILLKKIMKRYYEIVNYSNNMLFDLYEINEKNQKYKRFRIQKSELRSLLSSNEAYLFDKGILQFIELNERLVEQKAMILF